MKNNSGYLPTIIQKEAKLLVHICELGEQKTQGGIIIGSKMVEDDAYAATCGTLVEACAIASVDALPMNLKEGDVLTFRPYAGIHIVGEDNHAYRLLTGAEIHAKKINNKK